MEKLDPNICAFSGKSSGLNISLNQFYQTNGKICTTKGSINDSHSAIELVFDQAYFTISFSRANQPFQPKIGTILPTRFDGFFHTFSYEIFFKDSRL